MSLFWLSFCDESEDVRFLAFAIIESNSPVGAIRKAWDLANNSNQEIARCAIVAYELPPDPIDPSYMNRVLTRQEAAFVRDKPENPTVH
ncbi:hypothetical protein BJG93_14840 [Paraburkholderia sprentiae WSM5005]|uniref:Uncharacterized protein n=1 Tax=Paraburkholderia sprentiae WSM5005 TaxID=754502 RepID=A0A1I9YJP6_9BURK|nr:hypothetical protein [Paraburkholderia sprentiae]APA86529.2 hypothetical protein BJG93_14840 [Paraburkholderia sprentiae WSM5005]